MKLRRMVEVYLTNNSFLYGRIRKELDEMEIPYKTKIVNSGMQNRIRGTFVGRVGEKCNIENMYYIYVYREDVDFVKRIIAECRRR